MFPLPVSFLPMLPSLRAAKIGLAIAAVLAGFYAGWTVQGWRYKSQEVKAYQEQVERFREQANQDRAKLAERDKRLTEIDNEATKWRQRYRDLKRADPVTQAWSDTPHPPAIGLMLGGTLGLSSDSNPRP